MMNSGVPQKNKLSLFYGEDIARLLKSGSYAGSLEGLRGSDRRIGSWIVRSYLFVGKSVKTH
jgi:hypothetical protein